MKMIIFMIFMIFAFEVNCGSNEGAVPSKNLIKAFKLRLNAIGDAILIRAQAVEREMFMKLEPVEMRTKLHESVSNMQHLMTKLDTLDGHSQCLRTMNELVQAQFDLAMMLQKYFKETRKFA